MDRIDTSTEFHHEYFVISFPVYIIYFQQDPKYRIQKAIINKKKHNITVHRNSRVPRSVTSTQMFDLNFLNNGHSEASPFCGDIWTELRR